MYFIYRKAKFFVWSLKRLKSDPDNIKKVALLIYIRAVVTWLNMPIKEAKKRHVDVCSSSEQVNTHVMDTYSIQSNTGRYIQTDNMYHR